MKILKVNHLSVLVMLLAFSMFFPISQAEAKARSTGTLQALVLMVDFSDKSGQVRRTYFQDLIFGTKPAIAPLGSFTDYYMEVSYSQLSITGLVNDGITDWYRMPQTYSYYVNNQYGFGAYPQNTQKLVEDAVAAAKAAGLNFGPYDNDNDGYVDALFIIHAGRGAEFTGCTCDIWSHYLPFDAQAAINIDTGSVNAKGNKVYVRDYTFQPEYFTSLNDMTIGVYAHEFGHVLGLPDLYDTGSDGTKTQGIGRWSLMAGGSWNGPNGLGDSPAHPDAWSKKKLEWVKPTLSTSGTISIPQIETNKSIHMLCSNTQGQEYFLLENRQRTGFDSFLPGTGSGLAIYHIDEVIGNNDYEWYPGCTTCISHYKVALEQADGKWDLEKNINFGDSGDLYPGSTNNKTFNKSSTPNSNNYAGQTTGVSVSKISASNSTMTATVSVSATATSFAISPYTSLNSSAVAFDKTNYFVVWSDSRNGYYNIYGSRVTPCGKVLDSGGIPISIGLSEGMEPAVAFDGKNYLVVWQDFRSGTGISHIYGTLVDTSGQIITPGDFAITTAPNYQVAPSIAFDGTNYLVVWSDTRYDINNGVIMGTRITPDGIVLDPSGILITPLLTGQNQTLPSVAFDGNNYLVVWSIWTGPPAIRGAIVSPTGTVSGQIVVHSGNYSQIYPSVSFNPISNQFLAAWTDYRNSNAQSDIYGQLINRDGTLSGSNLSLAVAMYFQSWPSIAFDRDNHFVVWSDQRSGNGDIYGTQVSPSGVILTPNGKAIVTTRYEESAPTEIACSGFNCLVVFIISDNNGVALFGQLIVP